MARLSQLVDLLAKVVGRALARCCAPPHRGRRQTFKPTVSCYEVPDLCELPTDDKRHLWWSPEDFESFLSEQVEIAKAYSEAVERGEEALFGSNPVLANNSRRGLGLGRGTSRATNSQAHFTAVIEEQDRQRRLGVVDCEALARAAAEASRAEVQHSLESAARDAEDTRAYMAEATCVLEDLDEEAEEDYPAALVENLPAPGALPTASGERRPEASEGLSDVEDDYCDSFGEAFPALLCPHKMDSMVGDGLLRPVAPQQTVTVATAPPRPLRRRAPATVTVLSVTEKADSFFTFPADEDSNKPRAYEPKSTGGSPCGRTWSRETARGFGLPPGRLLEAGFLASGRQRSAGPWTPQPRRLSPPPVRRVLTT
ncbi:unnamed protein product [Prorocentrum cordatum]|uniref:Uncharacterized protein n=1 Tax=Prorocentrum cordatum TaxID=2364126 RepID=A0ABN9SKS2_9DINO|nr:unnamed protein product [Polarella glacialis]